MYKNKKKKLNVIVRYCMDECFLIDTLPLVIL